MQWRTVDQTRSFIQSEDNMDRYVSDPHFGGTRRLELEPNDQKKEQDIERRKEQQAARDERPGGEGARESGKRESK